MERANRKVQERERGGGKEGSRNVPDMLEKKGWKEECEEKERSVEKEVVWRVKEKSGMDHRWMRVCEKGNSDCKKLSWCFTNLPILI